MAVAPRFTSSSSSADAQNAFGLFIQQHIEGMELLAEGHRHRVLQLGAALF